MFQSKNLCCYFIALFQINYRFFITGLLSLSSPDKNHFPGNVYYSYFCRLNVILFFHRLSDHYFIEFRFNFENISVFLAQKSRLFRDMRNKTEIDGFALPLPAVRQAPWGNKLLMPYYQTQIKSQIYKGLFLFPPTLYGITARWARGEKQIGQAGFVNNFSRIG